ncbi:MAG: sugar phosphate isomerase/epimerase family protein [Pirellulaceae bacterium]
MPALKIGIQLASLRLPFKKALHTAADLGASAVEIDARGELRPQQMTRSGVRQIRKMMEDRNLTVSAVTFRTRRGYNVTDDLERRVDATKGAMRFAADLDASVVVNRVGRVPDQPTADDWEPLVEALSDLGAYGQRVGAWLAAETGSEAGVDLARLLDALPAGSVGVNLDPGNLIVNGFSAAEAVAAIGSHVLHVHAKDGLRDLAQGRGVETPLGQGAVDFPEILGALEEHNYRGYYTIVRDAAQNPVQEIGQSVQYLRSL